MEDFLKYVGLGKKSEQASKSSSSIAMVTRPFSDQFYYRKLTKRSRTLGLPLSFLVTCPNRQHLSRDHVPKLLRSIVCKDYEKYCTQTIIPVSQVKRKRRPLVELKQSYAASNCDSSKRCPSQIFQLLGSFGS